MKRHATLQIMTRSLSLFALCSALPFAALAEELALVGAWTLNVERTEAIQPDNSTSRWWEGLGGNFSTSVSVGGIPVPAGSPGPEPEVGSPGPPQMLRCQALTIERLDDGLHPLYLLIVGIAMIPPALGEVFLLEQRRDDG